MLRINTLGRLNVEREGQPVSGSAAQPRRLALLALLACAGDRGLTRDKLVLLLWPEADEDRARRGLSQALYALRQDLRAEDVFLGLKDLRLNPEVISSDVAEFAAAVGEGNLTKAVSVYRGPFLDGFHLPGSPEFERWEEEKRSELAREYADALERLARDAERRGDHQAAVGWWRKLAAQDPFNARITLGLMQALVAAGDRSGALQHARVYEVLLEQELDTPPDHKVVALAEQLRRERPAPRAEPTPEPEVALTPAPVERAVAIEPATGVHASAPTAPAEAAPPRPPGRDRKPAGTRRDLAIVSVVLLAGAALSAVLMNRTSAGGTLTPGPTMRVAFEAGLELDPAESPDGRVVAFAADYGGPMRLYVTQPGSRAVPISEALPGYHRWPRWAPGGAQIAFQSAGSIYVVPALGGAPTLFVAASRPERWVAYPAWSPDGGEVGYVENNVLYARPVTGGPPRRIADADAPHSLAWSPDGEWIAFASGNATFVFGSREWGSPINVGNVAPSSIWIVRSSGGNPVPVTDDRSLNTSPAWLSSRTLLFVSDRGGERDIYRLDLDQDGDPRGQPQRVTTGLGAHTVTVSPDGRRLVYAVFRQTSNIWSLPIPATAVSSSEARPVTTENQIIEGLAISPDGEWLAFDSNRNGNQDIYKMRAEGGDLVQLTSDPGDDFMSSWSPNGREIAFYSFRDGSRRLHVMSAHGGAAQPVVAVPRNQWFPGWSPDGHSLVFSSNESGLQELYLVSRNPDSTWRAARRLTFEGGQNGRWSPDGREIAFTRDDGLWVISLAGGATRQLVGVTDPRGIPLPGALQWAPDGRTIFYKAFDTDGRSHIFSVPAAGGSPRLLVRFDEPARQSNRPEFATDGRHLYFTITERESDVWEMELQ